MKKQLTYSEHPTRATRRAHAKGDKQFRTYDTSAINPRKRALPATIFAVILLLGAIGGAFWWFTNHFDGLFKEDTGLVASGTEVPIVIADGSSVADIGRTLKNAQLIERVDEFTELVKTKGVESDLKPGAYTIIGGTSVDDIVARLLEGPPTFSFTVPEGLTLRRVAQVVSEAYDGTITVDDFVAAATNAAAYAEEFPFVSGTYDNSLEGFLFPKTYDKADGDTADSVIRRMLSQYQSETAGLDYAYAEERGLSAYDVLKLASIIEREATDENRATVSSVFYNRLASGMQLQSDATVAYLVDGDPTPEDLQIDSPYNTYLVEGLPAGPICSPGIDSLQAACAPEETPYLYFYFVPKEDGSMSYAFSETYEEHQGAIEQG